MGRGQASNAHPAGPWLRTLQPALRTSAFPGLREGADWPWDYLFGRLETAKMLVGDFAAANGTDTDID